MKRAGHVESTGPIYHDAGRVDEEERWRIAGRGEKCHQTFYERSFAAGDPGNDVLEGRVGGKGRVLASTNAEAIEAMQQVDATDDAERLGNRECRTSQRPGQTDRAVRHNICV